jgi:hypothetical protein
VGDDKVGDYAIRQALGTHPWKLGFAEWRQSLPILGRNLYLSFENLTGHPVTLTARVDRIHRSPTRNLVLVRSRTLKPGEEISQVIPVSRRFDKAGFQVVAKGMGRSDTLSTSLESCPSGTGPERMCQLAQPLPKPEKCAETYLGQSMLIRQGQIFLAMTNHGDEPVTVNASAYLVR